MASMNAPEGRSGQTSNQHLAMRLSIAAIIVVLVLGYTVAVITGNIAPNHQLSATHLALLVLCGIAVSLMIWPTVLREIKSFSVGSIRVDIDRIQTRQVELEQFVKEILPFLLPDNLLAHLRALEASEQGDTAPAKRYQGSRPVRDELRQLRNMHLIEVKPQHRGLAAIPDGPIDLAAFVKLTNRGRDWTKRAAASA